jgi:predicted DNA binding protein
MWVIGIKVENKIALANRLAHKYKCSFFGYPLNVQETKEGVNVTFFGWTDAPSSKANSFFEELKKDSSVIHAEMHEQSIIILMKQPKETIPLYSSKIIYLQPVLVRLDFVQEYVLASWNREDLSEILKSRIPNVKMKLKFIREQPINNIGMFVPARLTQKQQKAFLLAQKEKYYTFPKRNIHLKELASLSGVSMATYQAHLRKAERKILENYKDLSGVS